MKLLSEHLTEEGFKEFIASLLRIDRKMISKKGLDNLSPALQLETMLAFLVNNSGDMEQMLMKFALEKRRVYYPNWVKTHICPVLLMQLCMYEGEMCRDITERGGLPQAIPVAQFHPPAVTTISVRSLFSRLGDSGEARPGPKSRLIQGCVGAVTLFHLKTWFNAQQQWFPKSWRGKKVYGFADIISHKLDGNLDNYRVACLNCPSDPNSYECHLDWESLESFLDPESLVLLWPGVPPKLAR